MDSNTPQSRALTAEEVERIMDTQGMDLEEKTQLYVARHKTTGLYSKGICLFLEGQTDWLRLTNPSKEMVINELRLAQERRNRWFEDLQEAEMWGRYQISQFCQYVPEVEFIPVYLTVAPISK